MTVTIGSAAAPAVPLNELKAYLRISLTDEDALLQGLIAAATETAERFTGQVLVERAIDETMPTSSDWRRLSIRPVRAITAVTGLPAEGAEFALPVDAYAIDIDRNGDGWVRIVRPGAAGRVRVRYLAGMSGDGAGIPETIRHGIVRLAGEYHARREGLETQPPAAVAALWRPWRRMRLS